jgi:hypothetical protein
MPSDACLCHHQTELYSSLDSATSALETQWEAIANQSIAPAPRPASTAAAAAPALAPTSAVVPAASSVATEAPCELSAAQSELVAVTERAVFKTASLQQFGTFALCAIPRFAALLTLAAFRG